MREELAEIVRQRELLDLPPGFDPSVAETSEANRSLLLLYSRVFGPEAMDAVRELSALPTEPLDTEFATLTEDAGEDTRQRLAERIAPNVHQQFERFPALRNPAARSPRGEAFTNAQVVKGLVEMYNVAQLDVLRRVGILVRAADGS
ncbi:hypothetical protein [Actinophytocola gossypii]|uniref:hypothetical protein n=1 Tax=Actinophytocola gossypii TaxID=2812003 RepID=UPI0028834D75|nr:hypothetical protein [Actinophytocola gossypii]